MGDRAPRHRDPGSRRALLDHLLFRMRSVPAFTGGRRGWALSRDKRPAGVDPAGLSARRMTSAPFDSPVSPHPPAGIPLREPDDDPTEHEPGQVGDKVEVRVRG